METLNDFTNPDEQVSFENEILKLKLEVEMGATAIHSSKDLPPEIENAWLNSVYNFEKEFNNPANKKTVFEHLGSPSVKTISELSPEEIPSELESLMQLLDENGIGLDFICEYEASVCYNFIVMELFPYEIIYKYEPGSMFMFTYEDFHPNYEYEIRRVTNEFLEAFFDKEEYHKFNLILLDHAILTKAGKTISREECLLIIRDVQQTYYKRRLQDSEIEYVHFDDKGGKSMTKIIYTSDGIDSNTVNVELEFTPNDYFYTINKIIIPGILEI